MRKRSRRLRSRHRSVMPARRRLAGFRKWLKKQPRQCLTTVGTRFRHIPMLRNQAEIRGRCAAAIAAAAQLTK